ncbi:glycosyltransferase [Psychroflexus tropicus]|uniref:glycosyltransferase n=1 Tax=Psychroflexus tropicus TaxID=197345 RepID=UPI00035EC2F0|nr:glycosyltransferase [Psychroflexus tropicus]
MVVVLILFIVSTVAILFQQFRIYYPLRKQFNKAANNQVDINPVSVIICARNEAKSIASNLKLILNQEYPSFEVIVVDDCSEDNTVLEVQRLQKLYSNLKLVQLTSKPSNSKRNALKNGVLASKNETILLTDADCRPVSKYWIQGMTAEISESSNCVLGYSPYTEYPTFLNSVIQFETLQTASLYMSQAVQGNAYMSVGRNVLYSKSLFLISENFENEKHLTSGDDDLLIQNIKDKKQITVSLAAETFIESQPKTNFTAWWKQKLRHYSSADYYSLSNKLFLGVFHGCQGLFWLSFTVLMFSEYMPLSLIIVSSTLLLKSVLMKYLFRIFKISNRYLWLWPILEICLMLLQLGLGINGRFKKHNSWQ